MNRTLMSAVGLAVAILPSVCLAQAIEEKNLLSGKAKIEPDSGYIFVNGSVRQAGLLLRLPDAETIAAYEKDWSEALAKVQAKYPKKLKAWQDRVETARLTGKAPPEPPIEPTPENFAISAIELRDPVGFGPQYAFAKAKDPDGFSYLMKVKPGRYVYYGQLFGAPSSGYFGTCYCMGTVAFDVKAGMITDTGNFFLAAPGTDPAFPPRSEKVSGSEIGLYRPVAGADQFGAVTFGLPQTLQNYPSERAEFRAYGKLDNFYGVTIGRMPPVPGVLAYDRDRIVDLKANAEPVGGAVVEPGDAASAQDGLGAGATGSSESG